MDQLGKEFKESGYDVKALCRWITNSRAYQLSSVKAKASDKEDGLFSQMQLKPMSPEQLFDSLLTATSAHRAGSSDDGNRRRDAWLRQFIFTFANDEADETTSFQGTIPQALMMMNGELMQEALSGKPGSFLGDVCQQAAAQRPVARGVHGRLDLLGGASPAPDAQGGRRTPASISQAYPDSLQVLQDLFWALLNSNEFVLIH